MLKANAAAAEVGGMVQYRSRPRGSWLSLGLVLAGILLALCLPPSARAETFCVNKAGCSGVAQPGVQQALNAAAANGVGTRDRIEIGPGTYADGATGRFTNVPNSPVTMVGSGDATILTSGSNAPVGTHVLTVAENTSVVSDLQVRIGSTAFGMSLTGAAERVSITSPANVEAHTGVYLDAEGVFRNGEIELLGPSGLSGTGATGPGTIEDSTIEADTGASAATTRRVRVRARVGVFCSVASLAVDQALIELTNESSSSGLLVSTFGGSSELDATNVTVVGAGRGAGIASRGQPFAGAGTADMNVSSSVVRGVSTSVQRSGMNLLGNEGTANVTIGHSSYDLATVTSSGPGILMEAAGNLDDVGARFAGAGDYRLRYDSPLIDVGDPASPGAGESGTDTAGQPRVVDGDGASGARRDMGAFEYQRRPPTAALSIDPAAPLPGQDVEFSAAGSADPDGEALLYAWEFTGAVAPGEGETVTRSFAVPGQEQVTLRVTDAAGVTTTRSMSFIVRDPADPGDPPDDPPDDPGDPPDDPGDPPDDPGHPPDDTDGSTPDAEPPVPALELPPPAEEEGPCGRLRRGTRRPDTLRGGAAGDRMLGLRGRDRLIGRGGDDCLAGGAGDDTLRGGAGRDVLKGGRGDDRINARDGSFDVVDCGSGRDRARVDRVDRVRRCERT